jgi:hypothetical protein
MAKLNGILKIEGTLENLTFYKSADGHMVRTKGGISKHRIMNDPAFVRTRENGTEFTECARAGKLLRSAVGMMLFKAKDSKLSSRMLKVMSDIKKNDLVSERGLRNVAEGLGTEEGISYLRGFDFNANAALKSVLYAPYTVSTESGVVSLPHFIPVQQMRYPQGATHFSLQSVYLNLDFMSGAFDIRYSDVVNLAIDQTNSSQALEPNGVPEGTGTQIYLLLIEFFQEINGVQYVLNNGAYNVLHILEAV